MDRKKTNPAPPEDGGAAKRRISRIVHDDRGNAVVEWIDAPDDRDRVKLEVDGSPTPKKTGDTRIRNGIPVLSIENPSGPTYNPYENTTLDFRKGKKPRKRDLRKLSEWIKLVRTVQKRKERGED